MRIRNQQLTSKAFSLIKDDSTGMSAGIAEVANTPLAASTPASAHTEVCDTERCRVHPLHDNHAWLAVADNHSAASPFDQKFPEFIRIHNSWSWYLNLWANSVRFTEQFNKNLLTHTSMLY